MINRGEYLAYLDSTLYILIPGRMRTLLFSNFAVRGQLRFLGYFGPVKMLCTIKIYNFQGALTDASCKRTSLVGSPSHFVAPNWRGAFQRPQITQELPWR